MSMGRFKPLASSSLTTSVFDFAAPDCSAFFAIGFYLDGE
jgi:hypothetical protein